MALVTGIISFASQKWLRIARDRLGPNFGAHSALECRVGLSSKFSFSFFNTTLNFQQTVSVQHLMLQVTTLLDIFLCMISWRDFCGATRSTKSNSANIWSKERFRSHFYHKEAICGAAEAAEEATA